MANAEQPDFQTLEPFVQEWGLPTREARLEKRLTTTIEDLRAFYEAMTPHLQGVIAFLDQWPLDKIPEEHRRLADTALMLCEIDNPVNKWRSNTLSDGVDPRRLEVKANPHASPQLDAAMRR